jgi:DNA-binding NtrC family response regulator
MAEVFIVDDDRNFRETLRELLTDAGYKTLVATNAEEAITLLQTATPDLTLCDWKMPGGGGEQFLKSLQAEGLLTTMPVIILTAHGTGPNAMQAMQLGAYDFITKPLDIDLALATVARAIRHMGLQREVELLRQQRFRDCAVEDISAPKEGLKPQLIGNSSGWIEVFKNIGRVAATDVGVLLLGESGTGQESSTVQRCLQNCWSPSCSGMNAVHSPAQSPKSGGSSRLRTEALSFWMRLANYRCHFSQSSCVSCKSTRLSGSAERLPSMLTHG